VFVWAIGLLLIEFNQNRIELNNEQY
jgi:hypothetical protein